MRRGKLTERTMLITWHCYSLFMPLLALLGRGIRCLTTLIQPTGVVTTGSAGDNGGGGYQ